MKRRIVFTSVVTIALCLCILTGSTFALFTSEDKVNIAVTAGTVKVEAKVDSITRTYTDFTDPTKLTEGFEDRIGTSGVYAFQNGGTAQLVDNSKKLVLTNIAPGDAVDLKISVKNTSTIAVKYLVRCTVETDAGTQELEITVNNIKAIKQGENVYSTGWDKMDPTEDISVTVWLPEAVGNAYQGKAATITFTVYAIQSNVTDSAANTQFGLN